MIVFISDLLIRGTFMVCEGDLRPSINMKILENGVSVGDYY